MSEPWENDPVADEPWLHDPTHLSAARPTEPVSSLAKWPAVLGSAAVHGINVGVGSPGDLVSMGTQYAPKTTAFVNDISTSLGLPLTIDGKNALPTSEGMEAVTNKLGLTGTRLGSPETRGQRLAAGAISGATAAIPFALTGDLPGALVVGGIGGTAAGATKEVMPDSTIAPIAAGTIAGMGAGSVLGDARNLFALRAATRAKSAAETAYANAKNNRAENSIAMQQLTAAQIADAKQKAEAARAALTPHTPPYEGIAAQFGKTQTLQEAGENLQEHGRKWLTTELPKRQAAAWSGVDQLIPPNAEIELPEYASALTSIANKGDRLAAPLKSPLFDKLNSRLKTALEPKEEIPGEEAKVIPLTWNDARELRTTLGDALGDPTTVRPIHQQDLANLYRSLTLDMGSKAAEISPQAAKAFGDANAASSKLFDFAEGPLKKVIAGKRADPASDPAPEAVAKRLVNSGKIGATDLAALRAEMPEAVDGLTAAFFRQQGPQWTKLSPEAKLALAQGKSTFIDQTIAKHEEDQAAFHLAHQTIKASLSDARAAAAANARGARAQLQATQRQSGMALQKANQRYEELIAKRKTAGISALGGIFGGQVGNELGIAGLHALGIPGGDFLHSAWGGLAGAMAPWVLRSTLRAVRQPKGPLMAVQGARAGTKANAAAP